MPADIQEGVPLDERRTVTLHELVAWSGLSEAEVRAMVEQGALAPEAAPGDVWMFRARSVVIVREITRLQREFALDDLHSACVVLAFRERIAALERELLRRGGDPGRS